MKNDLNHRFDFKIDETMDNFDCLYLLATELETTVPTKLLGTPPFFQCILMTLRVLEKIK